MNVLSYFTSLRINNKNFSKVLQNEVENLQDAAQRLQNFLFAALMGNFQHLILKTQSTRPQGCETKTNQKKQRHCQRLSQHVKERLGVRWNSTICDTDSLHVTETSWGYSQKESVRNTKTFCSVVHHSALPSFWLHVLQRNQPVS